MLYAQQLVHVSLINSKTRTTQSQDLLVRVHERGIGNNGSTHDIVGICEVDNNDLIFIILFLSNTDIMVGLEC